MKPGTAFNILTDIAKLCFPKGHKKAVRKNERRLTL